jgi:hypothetical protein
MRDPKTDSAQQHAKLLDNDLSRCFLRWWPRELVSLKALLPQEESITILVQRLQKTAVLFAE